MGKRRCFSVLVASSDDAGTMLSSSIDFDPKAVFGKARALVVVTINGYSYRSTIFAMGGEAFVPGKKIRELLALDEKLRTVACPRDLGAACSAAKAWKHRSPRRACAGSGRCR
jgi:hypothetical protein